MHVPIYKKLKGSSHSITDVQANTVSYYLATGYQIWSESGNHYSDPSARYYSPLLFVHDKNKDVYYFGPFMRSTGRTTTINRLLGYKLTEELFYKMVDEGKIIVLKEGFNTITPEEYDLMRKGKLTYRQLLNNIPD
jgi:hypothetical protein